MTGSLATAISIGKRGKGHRVYDAFVEDDFVAFGACNVSEMFGGGVPPKEVGVDHIDVASFVQRLLDFVEEVLTHDVIVELLGCPDIQGESPDFAADFALLGLVAVILVAGGREFCDDFAIIEFVRHFPLEGCTVALVWWCR